MAKAAFAHELIGAHHILMPFDDEGRDMLAALPVHKEVLVDIHTPRNPKHHRLLFALYVKLHDGGAFDGDQDSFLDWAKYATGHVRSSVDHRGEVHYVPKSIAFESMDQARFSRWFDRVCYHIAHRLLGSADEWEALRDDIINTVEGKYRR